MACFFLRGVRPQQKQKLVAASAKLVGPGEYCEKCEAAARVSLSKDVHLADGASEGEGSQRFEPVSGWGVRISAQASVLPEIAVRVQAAGWAYRIVHSVPRVSCCVPRLHFLRGSRPKGGSSLPDWANLSL